MRHRKGSIVANVIFLFIFFLLFITAYLYIIQRAFSSSGSGYGTSSGTDHFTSVASSSTDKGINACTAKNGNSSAAAPHFVGNSGPSVTVSSIYVLPILPVENRSAIND